MSAFFNFEALEEAAPSSAIPHVAIGSFKEDPTSFRSVDPIDDDVDEIPAEPDQTPVRGMASSPSKPNAYVVDRYLAAASISRASGSQQPQSNLLERTSDDASNKVFDLA